MTLIAWLPMISATAPQVYERHTDAAHAGRILHWQIEWEFDQQEAAARSSVCAAQAPLGMQRKRSEVATAPARQVRLELLAVAQPCNGTPQGALGGRRR